MADPVPLATIAQICQHLYGRTPRIRHIPSDEAHVFLLQFESRADRIIKFQRPDNGLVRQEQLLLPTLRIHGIGEAPEIEHTQDDLPGADAVFSIMPRTVGIPLEELYARDPRVVALVAEHLGDFLRRLAALPVGALPGAIDPTMHHESLRSWWQHEFAAFRQSPLCTPSVAMDVDAGLTIFDDAPTVFGGLQGIQLITDGASSFTVVDWSYVGATWEMADVASAVELLANLGDAALGHLWEPFWRPLGGAESLGERQRRQLQRWIVQDYVGGAAMDVNRGHVAVAAQRLRDGRHLLRSVNRLFELPEAP